MFYIICWILLCVYLYLILHQVWDIRLLLLIIIHIWKRNSVWLKFYSKFACKNLERMLVHVGHAYGKYVSDISPSCIILSVSPAHHLFFSMMHIMDHWPPVHQNCIIPINRLANIFSIIEWITEFKIHRAPFGW
jgi:hypothetical protein